MEFDVSMEPGTCFITTTDCEHCGREFRIGDSYTVDEDGKTVKCIHWPVLGSTGE